MFRNILILLDILFVTHGIATGPEAVGTADFLGGRLPNRIVCRECFLSYDVYWIWAARFAARGIRGWFLRWKPFKEVNAALLKREGDRCTTL